jgi:hypothetical protein
MKLNDRFEVTEEEMNDQDLRDESYTCHTCGSLVDGQYLEEHNEWHERVRQ